MKFGVVIFPGSNCDYDTFNVLRDVFQMETVFLWHKDHNIKDADCIILPGGFSYGDYLRSGAIAKFSPLMQEVHEFASRGGLVLGICNGFQILLELGLLPGAMLRNKNLKFLCQHIHIRIEDEKTPFTNRGKKGQVLRIPIAHFDGNYYDSEEAIEKLKRNNQIVFRYSEANGRISEKGNINGSKESVAGIINKAGNVMGMMPHPERASETILGSEDGKIIFQSIINWL
ncbi:MAG: phosphoribosylformylglycinamidine synthase subunit PurQ, partial [Candidatus Aminicenantes bacterium]|nr:phosphoribosylformylglycinamidine synthase subunit PurQ [Candidatus Aminicenantes bacterium]